MPQFTLIKTVNAPLDKVWASWDDFANIDVWNPNITESYLLSGSEGATGIGTKRHCDMPGGKHFVRENITKYELNKRIELEVYETSMPMKKMVIDTVLTSISRYQTEVTQTTTFEMKMGIFGKLMGLMMKKQFRVMMQKLLDANADYVERGVTVERAA